MREIVTDRSVVEVLWIQEEIRREVRRAIAEQREREPPTVLASERDYWRDEARRHVATIHELRQAIARPREDAWNPVERGTRGQG